LVSVEFHFDFGSPNAYLAHLVLPLIEERTGVSVAYVPVLLGGVFKATNNVSPMVSLQGIKNKGEYTRLETERFVAKHGLADRYRMNPHFPVNTLQIMRGAVAAESLGADVSAAYVNAIYASMWDQPKKMDDVDVIRQTLADAGLPADALIDGIQTAEVKAKLIENTQASVDRGVFGSPSFFVGDELYLGKDSLGDLEEAIVLQG